MKFNRMKTATYSLILIFSISLSAQELKEKSRGIGFGILEKYSVLKSDKKVRHGYYYQLYKNDTIVFGQYDNDVKKGVWKYYNRKGKNVFVYDFDNSRVLEWECEPKFQICRESGSAACCSLGNFAAGSMILSNLKYPRKSQENGHSGKPTILLVINDQGNLEQCLIGKSSGYKELDNAALETVAKSCKEKWIPAYDRNGDATQDTVLFTVNFIVR